MLYGRNRRQSVRAEIDWLGEQASTAAPKRRGKPEQAVQRAIRDFLRYAFPGAKVPHFANEHEARGEFDLANRARNGVEAGCPDLCAVLPPLPGEARGNVLWIECKAGKGKPTEAQLRYHDDLRALGHVVAVCRSIDDAEAAVRAMGYDPPASARIMASRGGRLGRLTP